MQERMLLQAGLKALIVLAWVYRVDYEKKILETKSNWSQPDLLTSRIFEIQVYFIQITLAQK